jgi:hypothetical protein
MSTSQIPDDHGLIISAVRYEAPVGKPYGYKNGKVVHGKSYRSENAVGETMCFKSFHEFVLWRMPLVTEYMLVSGSFDAIGEVTVVYKGKEDDGSVSASKKYLNHRKQAGILIIDIDFKDETEVAGLFPVGVKPYASHEVALDDLSKVLPEADDCALLIGWSTSSNLFIENELVKGTGGIRIYIPVMDASKIPEILETIHKRCWLHGLGWAFIDGGAGFQERSLVDQALARPTQPDYAAPDLQDGLVQDRGWEEFEGDLLDPENIAPLTSEEEVAYQAAVAEARKALKPVQKEERKAWIEREVERAASKGLDRRRARKNAERRLDSGVLMPTDTIIFDGGEEVSCLDLLLNGEAYDGRACCDPVEPDYDGGRAVGKFFWNDGDRSGVHSFAHGQRWYLVRHDLTSLKDIIETGDRDAIVIAMARTEFADRLEEAEAESLAAKSLSLGNGRNALRDAVEREKQRIAIPEDADESNSEAEEVLIEEGRYPLDRPLPRDRFPFLDGEDKILDHQDNLAFMLQAYGIRIAYDTILKTLDWSAPGLDASTDNANTTLFSLIKSLAALNGLAKGNESLHAHLPAIAEQQQVNPVNDYLSALSWDGVDRFEKLSKTLGAHDSGVALVTIRRWFVQACAAADGAELARQHNPQVRPVYEYVLVQVGTQGVGKTKGLSNIVPKKLLAYLKESVVLKINDKDSIKIAVSCWIAELGELDATFRAADHVAFKAFMSRETDEMRMPYAPATSHFQRRTVFFGSVNEDKFLKDKTGARRFYPLAVDRGFPAWSDEEVDQLWAQAWSLYASGERWWPTDEEELLLAENAESFRQLSWEEERLEAIFDWESEPIQHMRLTATELWRKIAGSLYGEKTAKSVELSNIAKAMTRLWCEHGAWRENGRLMLNTPEGPVQVLADGGNNRGWLVPMGNRVNRSADAIEQTKKVFDEFSSSSKVSTTMCGEGV